MLSRFSWVSLWATSLAVLPAQGAVRPSLLKAPEAPAQLPPGVPQAIQVARAAVVHVVVEVQGDQGSYRFERPSTGVVVDPTGLVVTFRHLVAEAIGAKDKALFVQLDDSARTRLPATVEKQDAATDLVLLRVAPPAGGLVALPLVPAVPEAGEALAVLAIPEGKDLLAWAGVATPAQADVVLRGNAWPRQQVFLTDTKQDVRADGGVVLDGAGRLLGLYAAEHVQRDLSEPTLEDLKKPSFGVVVPAAAVAKLVGRPVAAMAAPSPTAAAVAAIAPSLVAVFGGEGAFPTPRSEDPGAVQRVPGLGSGVVVGQRGLVVTNAHLVSGEQARVRLADGRELPARVVRKAGDQSTNLALLAVELPAGVTLTAATCAADDDLLVGETVLAVGNPFGVASTATAGIVSARRGGGRVQADLNLGNQNGGGAIVDLTGRLVGIADGGAIDPLEMAYAMRGDRVSTETNLSTFVGIQKLRTVFAAAFDELAADEPSRHGVGTATPRQRGPLAAMVERVGPAMLNVYVARNMAKTDPDDPFAEMQEKQMQVLGVGSGVIIDPSGLALSNWHVVDEAVRADGSAKPDHAVTVRVFGGKTYEVEVLSISREDDLSLLQLKLAPGETVTAVELGSAEALRIGEPVAAIGNPHNRANTVTYGVVTCKEQELRVRGRWAKLEHLIETDAAINGGNSGGALLDLEGRLVGINSAGGGTFTNRGYAIGVDHVRRQLLTLLLQAYKLRSPDLGLRVLDDDGRVLVMDVDPRGPAAAAGVKSGDRVVSLGGEPIAWSPAFALRLRQAVAGEPLALVVERAGTAQTFQVQPLASEVWSVVRQSGLRCRDLAFGEAPERVREAAIALHRQLVGDPAAEPTSIPNQVVQIEQVFADGAPPDLQAGDLLLALELKQATTGDAVFVRLEELRRLRDLWNDRDLGTYEGSVWKLWIARGTQIRNVELTVKRLFW